MKIEIIISKERLADKCTGMTCFEAPTYIANAIRRYNLTQGVVLIDNVAVKFSFSSNGMDGDIFTSNDGHRMIIKYLIPLYMYNLSLKEDEDKPKTIASLTKELMENDERMPWEAKMMNDVDGLGNEDPQDRDYPEEYPYE